MANQPHVLSHTAGRPTNAVQAADYIISAAIQRKASDIHIGVNHTKAVAEPFFLRFRIQGKLVLINGSFMEPFFKEVIARFKIMAGLNTTEIGIPQDGQINLITPHGPMVVRISLIPGSDGDEVVMRVQDGHAEDQTIENLGMVPTMLSQLNVLISQKSGLIVLSGPAGTGKTSTICAILKKLASSEKKILTAEDPIESHLPWVSHTQVTAKTNFIALSRAFLRQDADVIFIGEVRDAESATATIQLAQTGHLVLTTMHTRDAIGVVGRLEAFEILPNFIADSLIGAMAQRLVPALCEFCSIAYTPEADMQKYLNALLPIPADAAFRRAGPGCEKCIKGYAGRRAVFELLAFDLETADMINRRAPRSQILVHLKKKGMRTLLDDILDTIYSGFTDIQSVRGYLVSPR